MGEGLCLQPWSIVDNKLGFDSQIDEKPLVYCP